MGVAGQTGAARPHLSDMNICSSGVSHERKGWCLDALSPMLNEWKWIMGTPTIS